MTAVGEFGAILTINYDRFRLLLLPGADPSLVNELAHMNSVGRVTAILLPDGGSAAVNPTDWLAQLSPLVALISVEAGSDRGLPSPEVQNALPGSTILRTDVHGWVELASDGRNVWVLVERHPRSTE